MQSISRFVPFSPLPSAAHHPMDYYSVSAERNSYIHDPSYPHEMTHAYPYAHGAGSYFSSPNAPYPSGYLGGLPLYPSDTFPQHMAAYNGYFMPSPHSSVEYPIPGMHYGPTDVQPEIHAPIPLSAYSTLIPPPISYFNSSENAARRSPEVNASDRDRQSTAEAASPSTKSTGGAEPESEHGFFVNAPQGTIPTPCDLLTDMAARAQAPADKPDSPDASITPKAKSKAPKAKPDSDKPAGNQRKAYFRDVSENVGFEVTDPDTITSHDKKRHYLECVERYILWLHDRLRMANQEPFPMVRMKSGDGLSIPSIRILLLHMQYQMRELNQVVEEERQINAALRKLIMTHRIPASPDGNDHRRHSIASDAIPAMAALQPPLPQ